MLNPGYKDNYRIHNFTIDYFFVDWRHKKIVESENDNCRKSCNNKYSQKKTFQTKQCNSVLNYQDMNTHQQTESPGKTTVK